MKNLSDTGILKTFEERRPIFRPYGLTCEKWAPRPMGKYDRHNEIVLNLVPDGCLSYVFHDRMMSVPAGRLTIFWGLIPHRVAGDDGVEYYICGYDSVVSVSEVESAGRLCKKCS